MQRKLNDEFIRDYSGEFSEKITSDFFAGKGRISGKEILNVSPSKQVNFFILKTLFRKWQEEMKRLDSPFFNYKNPEVRKAMVQFMNTLSQHIEVSKDYFNSMVEEAVADTLLLAMEPGSYLALEFEEMDVARVTAKMTKPILKYINLHKIDIEAFFNANDGVGIDDFVYEAETYFRDIDSAPVVRNQVELMSQVVPLHEDDLFYAEEGDLGGLDQDTDEEEEYSNKDYWGDSEEEPESGAIQSEEIAVNHLGTDRPDSKEAQSQMVQEIEDSLEQVDEQQQHSVDSTHDIPERSFTESGEDVQQDDSINQMYAEKKPSINDRFSGNENATVAKGLDSKQLNSIMEAISVNHRYMFTKELFDGDRDAFVEAISTIDGKDSFDDAVELMVQKYANKRGWDMNSDEVKELLKVVFRRFR